MKDELNGGKMKARVYVTLKEGVLDPQGKAVRDALHALGFGEVAGARIGKYIELELEGSDAKKAGERVKEMCSRLLANTVIEGFKFEVGK